MTYNAVTLRTARQRQASAPTDHAAPAVACPFAAAVVLTAFAIVTVVARPARAADPSPATAPAVEPETDSLDWITNLEEGYKAARASGRPVLVYGGADWCGPCRLLRKEMAKPAVRAKLAGWTLVYLDVDKLEGQPDAPAFSAIPAMSLQTPGGRVIDSREGFVPGDELVEWLDKHRPEAAAVPNPDLTAEGAPDAEAVARLVAKLTDGGEGEQRDAVIRRLRPHAAAAAPAVAAAFAKGKLAARLAALELLDAWDAPGLGDVDPWLPETITDDKLKALADWATERAAERVRDAGDNAEGGGEPSTRPAEDADDGELTEKERADASREIDRLLDETGDAEARAAVERLSRLGRGLLPEVYTRLQRAATDRQRQRLTALRYRLVASDALVLGWPAGMERLAAPDPAARHAAAGELAKRAGAGDAPLLMELFGDPDPLVREISLRGLRALGGGDSAAAMAKLLDDPTTNVRAAVLKELAAATGKAGADPAVVAHVIAYAARETDPDLLVHAVRFFRETKREDAATALAGLLGHESWRVRAEAAEALGQRLSDHDKPLGNKARAQVTAALTKVLEDPDGFVVSRAVVALKTVGANEGKLVERLAASAEKHPEIAPEAVKALAELGATAGETLRKFCAHADESVRAAAIGGLCAVEPQTAAAELAATLADPSERVRLAASEALFKLIENLRPKNQKARFGTAAAAGATNASPDPNGWPESFRSGRDRPKWLDELLDEVERNLAAGEPELRLRAACILVAAGRDELGLPVLRQAAKDVPAARGSVAAALPWLPWEARLSLFDELLALGLNDGQTQQLARALGVLPDARAAAPLWALLERPGAGTALAQGVFESLRALYLGDKYYNMAQVPAAGKKAAAEAAKAKAAGGNELQRLVALGLLVMTAPEDASAAARQLYDDPAAPAALRLDAVRVMFMTLPAAEARDLAAAALGNPDGALQKLALAYLAVGDDGTGSLRDAIYVSSGRSVVISNGQAAEAPPLPKSLDAALLERFAAAGERDGGSADEAQSAAYASYLLARLGNLGRIDSLLRYWRRHKQEYGPWKELVYRSIASANDDGLTPVLQEVYETYDKQDYELREFYWTIRSMKGPNVLALRKRMREEVGMEILR